MFPFLGLVGILLSMDLRELGNAVLVEWQDDSVMISGLGGALLSEPVTLKRIGSVLEVCGIPYDTVSEEPGHFVVAPLTSPQP